MQAIKDAAITERCGGIRKTGGTAQRRLLNCIHGLSTAFPVWGLY